jgi:uncharacterized protein YdhG (YjbR/CyaY superfamily)
VASVDEFFARLSDVERPHMQTLRRLSLEAGAAAGVRDELKWNFPAYTLGTMVWTLQCFKNHCSIRFPVTFFAPYRDEVAAAGYEAIEGALKIFWGQQVPEALISKLIKARIADFQAGNTKWSEPGSHTGSKKR